jgi:hypothetical protein
MGFRTACWIWTGATINSGYGKIASRRDGRCVFELVHRVTWTATFGPIPAGLQLDHLCEQTKCANPTHVEPVTAFSNNRRQQLRRLGQDITIAPILCSTEGRRLRFCADLPPFPPSPDDSALPSARVTQ